MGWRRFIRRRWWDEERALEIEAYLEAETADNIARGMPPDEAAAAARRKFGNQSLIREEIYGMNTIGWIESLWRDLRYASRTLRMAPGFTVVAILSLALGVGANTAIFQLLDAIRLRSLPVAMPEELAEVKIVGGNHGMGLNQRYGELTRPIWQVLQGHQHSFSGMFAWSANERYVGQGSQMRRFSGIWVTGDFFRVLGLKAWRGRLLMPEDAGACPVTHAVVSYAYWQSELAGREPGPDLKMIIDNDLVEVVGVAPPQFFGMAVGDSFDFILPLCRPPQELRRDVFEVTVMGRMKPGVTIERASAEMNTLSAGVFEATVPPGRDPRITEMYTRFRLAAYPAGRGVSWLRDSYDRPLLLLLAIAALVLLIACANLANLMLARASAREREFAVRLALGASRARLVCQSLAESALLAAAGTAAGVALARVLGHALITTQRWSPFLDTGIDWRVFLFATAAAVLTCAAFGVVPAVRASRGQPSAAMKAGGRSLTGNRQSFSLQRFMVITQISVSLVLLVAALLFVRSFRNLITFNPGMRESGISTAFLGYWQSHLPQERWTDFARDLLEEVRSTPGVLNAATTTNTPLTGGSWEHGVRIGAREGNSKFTWVSPSYFETMAVPVIRGRGLASTDTATSTRVAIVNQTFVRQLLGGADPLGKTLRTGQEPNYPSTVYEIVGVIPDTQYNDLRGATPPMAFAPIAQFPAQGPWTVIMVQSNEPSAAITATLRRRLAVRHPDVIMEFGDFQATIRDGLTPERLMAELSGFFGALAAVLAMVGLYGVVSFLVARRRNEIGIRLALGAERGQVVALVMRDAARMLAFGIVIGTGIALLAGRSAAALLFGLQPYDPLTFASAGLLLAGIAAAASFIPARRAARLDPMAALRDE